MQIHMISATFPIYGETSDLVSVDYENHEDFEPTLAKCKERLEQMFQFATEWHFEDYYEDLATYTLKDQITQITLARMSVPGYQWLSAHEILLEQIGLREYVGQMREQEDDCDSKFYDLDDLDYMRADSYCSFDEEWNDLMMDDEFAYEYADYEL